MQPTTINIESEAPPMVVNYQGQTYKSNSDIVFSILLDARTPLEGEQTPLPSKIIYDRFNELLTERLGWPDLPLHALITISDEASQSVTDLKKKSSETTNSN